MTLEDLQHALSQISLRADNAPKKPNLSALMARLETLSKSDSGMQTYLEQLLPISVELFSAQAGMIWLRAHGSQTASFAIRYRVDSIGWDNTDLKKHDRILQLGWQQKQPMFVEPQSKKKATPQKQFHLVFGPIIHQNESLALLEMLLPANEPIAPAERRLILRAMQLLIDTIHQGLQKRLALPYASYVQAEHQMKQLELEIAAYQQSIQRSIEARLRQFQGWTFGSLAENTQFAKMVHKILDEHGLRVRCPECGFPAILRCSSAGNCKTGVFVFDHYLDEGRTFHGGPHHFSSHHRGPQTGSPPPDQRSSVLKGSLD